jgi:hypothetical protein
MRTEGCIGEVRSSVLSPRSLATIHFLAAAPDPSETARFRPCSPPREYYELTQRYMRLLVGSSGPGCDAAGGAGSPFMMSLRSEYPRCYPFRYLSNQAMVLAHASFAASGL